MYFDEYLDVCPAYGWEGGPEFSTRIVALSNGRERRNGNWQMPRHKYSAPFQNITKADYAKILRMFMACQGQLNCFRFRDELNYEAVDQPFGVGTGAQVDFQLTTISTVDGIPYARNVYALAGNPVITVNGTATTAFSVDKDRGIVTFNAPPAGAALLKWSGKFDVWVRFNDDHLPFSIDNRNADLGEIINGSVNLIEVPPPPEGS